jgi:prevent-host-death family protein
MTTLMTMSDFDQILPVTDVKRDLLALVKRIGELQQSIGITKKGRPAAVLLSIEEYDGLLETIEILSDPKTVRKISLALKELEAGKTLSDKEVWGL